ncbi:hypothetical protein GCM10010919_14580 [Alishewanella longhuensis]|uniref:Uncharacterized protein n=1 Tax=Alishewanella longhuensis TaxID=1091037 RepID=A0ABQ3KWQ8_9ALTE|nr:hypothetical protein [Alishewanella longhuensis]GHG66672.1 hypothetical protein GCM10010919_14580 [Alishewanella longhuensis]
MTSDEFAELWKMEKDSFLKCCVEADDESELASYVRAMNLSPDQKERFDKAIDQLLTDVFYTLLLGLDGSASIGGVQQPYKILDENDSLISECGDLEAAAYEKFHGA